MTKDEIHSLEVSTPGLRCHCRAAGTQEGGRVVVMLHGFASTSHEFRHQLPALARAGHPTFAVDMRGFGRTDKPRIRVSRAMLAYDIVQVCKALGLEDVTLVGRDWGALVAFKAAIDYPQLFTRLVLIDAGCTVFPSDAGQILWYKVFPLPEAFFANHAKDFIEARYGGKDGRVLGGYPGSPYHYPHGPQSAPSWITPEDLEHYVESFDEDSQFAAIQYYRYALPLHRVVPDPKDPYGERYQLLSEADVTALWLNRGAQPAAVAREYFDVGPEDRHKRYQNPAMLIYGNRMAGMLSERPGTSGDGQDQYAAQFRRYFTDFRAEYVDSGHFIPEEQPRAVSNLLLQFSQ